MNTDGNTVALDRYLREQDALERRDMAVEEIVEEIFDDAHWLADVIRDADPGLAIEKVLWEAAEVALERRVREADEAAAEAQYELMAGDR